MSLLPPFDDILLERLCEILGDTRQGLTGAQIGALLCRLEIPDINPTRSKRVSLFAALSSHQRTARCGDTVAAFLEVALQPVPYIGKVDPFEDRRSQLNSVLAGSGYELRPNGKLQRSIQASTPSEAENRAERLRAELERRQAHPDVLRFCRAELLQNNYFHAVFEATNSVTDKIRVRTGPPEDGRKLAQRALGLAQIDSPYLAFNSLRTRPEQAEQTGLMDLAMGIFKGFRNTTSHEPRVAWPIEEQDALDLLTIVSFLHRRIDAAVTLRLSS